MLRNHGIKDFFKPYAKPKDKLKHNGKPTETIIKPRVADKNPSLPSSSQKEVLEPRTLPHNPPSAAPLSLGSTTGKAETQGLEEDRRADMDLDVDSTDTSSLDSFGSDRDAVSPQRPVALGKSNVPSSQPSGASFVSSSSFSGSSQRIVRNGETLVTNSDDEDSDASLVDMDALLGRPKSKAAVVLGTNTTQQAESQTSTRYTRSMGNSLGTRAAHKPNAIPVEPKYKFSLDALAATMEKEDAQNAGVEEALKTARMVDAKIASLKAAHDLKEAPTGNTASAFAILNEGDDESAEKTLQAIERTEAFDLKREWHFFAGVVLSGQPAPFPALKRHPLTGIMSGSSNRDVAFMSRLVEEVGARSQLPEELLLWVLDTVPFEARRDLHDAYCSILRQNTLSVASLVDIARIRTWFLNLGASEKFVDENHILIPVLAQSKKAGVNKEHGDKRDWNDLQGILRLLTGICKSLEPKTLNSTLLLLFKTALDTNVSTSGSLILNLQTAIDSLISVSYSLSSTLSTPADLNLLPCLNLTYTNVPDSQLRLRLLRILNTSSPPTALLRRRLALSFLFSSPTFLTAPARKPTSLFAITSLLRTDPRFRVTRTRDFNWSALEGDISILNIALADGDPPRMGLDAEKEKRYNAAVDELVHTIRGKNALIKEGSTSSLARTEAKEALDALKMKLEFAVRTKKRPKRRFVDEGRDGDIMSLFGKKTSATPNSVTLVNEAE